MVKSHIVLSAIDAFLIHPIALHRVCLQCTVAHKTFHPLVHQRFINIRSSVIDGHSEAAKDQGKKD